jgi:hypothetical protein
LGRVATSKTISKLDFDGNSNPIIVNPHLTDPSANVYMALSLFDSFDNALLDRGQIIASGLDITNTVNITTRGVFNAYSSIFRAWVDVQRLEFLNPATLLYTAAGANVYIGANFEFNVAFNQPLPSTNYKILSFLPNALYPGYDTNNVGGFSDGYTYIPFPIGLNGVFIDDFITKTKTGFYIPGFRSLFANPNTFQGTATFNFAGSQPFKGLTPDGYYNGYPFYSTDRFPWSIFYGARFFGVLYDGES